MFYVEGTGYLRTHVKISDEISILKPHNKC